MTIATVAFVPSAPLLVPAIAGGSAALDDDLRAACLSAVRALVASAPDQVAVVATVSHADWSPDATWDFHGFGVRREPPAPGPALPWQLGIGSWWLDRAGWTGERRFVGALDAPTLTSDGSLGVLVVGDGSSCRGERAPGYDDERGEPFDAEVARCLAHGDPAGLLAINAGLADAVGCTGLPAWRLLASSLGGAPVHDAELLADAAPYGVGYLVAVWAIS